MGKIELTIQVDESLAEEARARGQSLEDYVADRLKPRPFDMMAGLVRKQADPEGAAERAKQWAEENAEAIKAYNERIARRGVFGEDLRRW